MLSKISIMMIGLLLMSLTSYYVLSSKYCSVQEDLVSPLIERLWSEDDEERHIAKERLVELGTKAVPPLISLLQDLNSNPSARYARGEERNAHQIEASLKDRLINDNQNNRRELQGHTEQLLKVRINWRLKEDACELLGRLHAEEAIPILIKELEHEPSVSAWESMTPAMQALVQIGPPTVPQLITALQTARERASSISFGNDQPSGFYITTETAKNQARAAMVLGEIGDSRALPVLRELRKTTDSQWLIPYLDRAIVKIE